MKKLLLVFLVLTIFACKTSKKEIPTPPNVVFIFADDMTYSAINSLGNNEIQTPNLDRLVNQGTTFTNAYNMGAWNGAICAASRAMLLSGRSVWDVNKFRKNWSNNKEFDKTWSKLMEGAGYDTYMTGKWHIDAKADSVFQNVTHIRPGMPGDAWEHEVQVAKFKEIKGTDTDPATLMPIGYNRPLSEQDTTWSPTDPKFGGFWEGGKHWSEVLKDDAVGFIEKAEKSDNPFFMYLAFNAPHDPRQAPQEYLDKYPLENISLPKSWLPEYPFKDDMGCGPNLRDEALAPFPRTEYATKVHIKEYYAIITHLDAQIGEVLDRLEATGKMDNTYIIFTADHGLAAGKHGLIGKQSQFDHSIRAPFMITGPNIPENKKVTEDIYLQDAMATSLELANIEKPKYVFFNSILDLAKGKQTKSNYDAIYNGYVDLQRMIRKDGFKLIIYPKINKVLLFDMNNDPEEMNNLADNQNYKTKVTELFKDLVQLQKDMNDPLDLTTIIEL
ncbi:sulfatase-like hydrolase/transferase [Seonamhaeicola maritimus]|uniref:Sulfatase-like hydrolase/transferase n=1 Tax=Seonamhaeicola maritimus TaxID=2591822 RepID=A0A5C7GLP8_9FLAO|nr:sulfatase-like hydrolase/transferase [Seonamhaeicola maritimus]TXG39268.1 sulfatase-like hydrolase/transferase [Seonamhaeicola maritimus]